ncbi:hypothetical protein [Exercitatus varius]|nr:hypothetical protein [Exercitatus varius]MDG2952950.1 hypothetical protein [Exercitatus varius]
MATEINDLINYSYTPTEKVDIKMINQIMFDKKIKIIFTKHKDGSEHEDNVGKVVYATQNILAKISINNKKTEPLIEYKSVPVNGQKILNTFCINEKKEIILILMLSYGDSSRIFPWFIQFRPAIFTINKDGLIIQNDKFINYFNNDESNLYSNNIIIDNTEDSEYKPYPYYTEARILDRAYEIGLCEKNSNTTKIIKNKVYLYETNFKISKMYLIKGDKVTILNEKTDDSGQKWYFINYKGKKDINMWIKAEAVDIKE